MTKVTSEYLPAMQALNDFYAMLYHAMVQAMPDALLSITGAYVWRGYRIDAYKNLAKGQYYCQFDASKPKILEFKESFQYKSHYKDYPICTINLIDENFFSKNSQEQLVYLIDFVQSAANMAVQWQDSDERKQKVPALLWEGKKNRRCKYKGKTGIKKVREELVMAFPMQDKLFSLLRPGIERASSEVFSREVNLRPNASWYNWGFRGYRMKLKNFTEETPKGPSDFVWRNYFDSPHLLACERYKGRQLTPIPPFHLNQEFLSATEEVQSERLYQYALESLQIQ